MKNRNTYLDIIKGLGIISVVIGHAFYIAADENTLACGIKNFVYVYHLTIFFWVSGSLYKSKSVKDFLKKIWKTYIKYVLIALASYILLPLWYFLRVIEPKSLYEIVYQFAHIILFQVTRGVFTGPMWFVTWLTIAQMVFFAIDKLLFTTSIAVRGAIYCLLGICGMMMSYSNFLVHTYYFDRALLVQPILYLGFLCRDIKISAKWAAFLCPASAVAIIILNSVTGFHMELSHGDLYGYWLFYPITLIGVVFCVTAAHIIERSCIEKIVAFLGRESFIIMAAHIMGFKLVDGLIGKFDNGVSTQVLRGSPTAFSSMYMCVIYTIVGILVPILLWKLIQYITHSISGVALRLRVLGE